MAAVESGLTRARARARAAERDRKSTDTSARAAADAARTAFLKASARARQEERRTPKASKTIAKPDAKISAPRPKAGPRVIKRTSSSQPERLGKFEISEADLN